MKKKKALALNSLLICFLLILNDPILPIYSHGLTQADTFKWIMWTTLDLKRCIARYQYLHPSCAGTIGTVFDPNRCRWPIPAGLHTVSSAWRVCGRYIAWATLSGRLLWPCAKCGCVLHNDGLKRGKIASHPQKLAHFLLVGFIVTGHISCISCFSKVKP